MRHSVTKPVGWLKQLCRLAPVLFLSLVLGGCFAPRTYFPLAEKERPALATAVLPVTPGQISLQAYGWPAGVLPRSTRLDEENRAVLGTIAKTYDDVVHISNSVLDSLAAGADSPLLGPSKLKATLGDALELYTAQFNVYVDDPGPLDESWKNAGFAELAGKLGTTRVVRVKIAVEGEFVEVRKAGMGMVDYQGWDGVVTVTAELWSLAPAHPLAYGTGKARYWAKIGVVGGGQLPFALGKTFGRAVDQAARQALAQVFQAKAPEEAGK